MAPLPPDGTPRFRVNYTVNGDKHDFQIRSHASPSAIGTHVNAFLTALATNLRALTIGTVEFAATGSGVFLPVVTGIEGNTYGSGSGTTQERPYFFGFIGRGATGRRWHLDVFGATFIGVDFINPPGSNTVLDNAVAALQAWGADLVDIADAQVTVYSYVNSGVNAHWQRAIR